MDSECKWAGLRRQYDNTKFQLVIIELDLAITYCHIAAVTADQVRFYRNIANAERAYCAAACFLDGRLTALQNLEIKAKLDLFSYLRTNCDGCMQIQ